MAQFAFIYVGGEVPESKREQSFKDWGEWMAKLGASGKLAIAGAPFGGGTVLSTGGGAKAYNDKTDSNVTGYSVVEAANLEEAVALTKGCPQLDPQYGKAILEVREVYAM